jgi:hypothetical protein
MNENQKKSKVFITNKKSQDFSKAVRYGDLIPVTAGTINIFNVDSLQRLIHESLADFNPATDYILVAGNSIVVTFVMIEIIRSFPDSKLKILIYDGVNNDYVVREV